MTALPEYLFSRQLKKGMKNPYDSGKRSFFTRLQTMGFLKKLPYPISAFILFVIPLLLMLYSYSPFLLGNTPEVMEFFLPLTFICALIFWMSFPVTIIMTKFAEDNIFWELWYELRPLIQLDEEKYKELVARSERKFYSRKWNIIFLIAAILIIMAYVIAFSYGLYSVTNYAHIISSVIHGAVFILIVYVLIISGRTGYNIIRITKDLQKYEYNLNPLDPDRFGGFSAIGELAIENTLTTSGVLTMFLPYAIFSITTAEIGGLLGTYLIVFSYIVILGVIILILYAFFSPTLNIHYIAQKEREKILVETAKTYEKEYQNYLQYRRDVAKDESRFEKELQKLTERGILVTVLNNRYLETEKMKIYPFTTRTLLKLVSSLLPPLIVAIINQAIAILS